jgi:hypothetical protein
VTGEFRDEADLSAIGLECADESVTGAVRGDHWQSERRKCRSPVRADEILVAQRPAACLASSTTTEARKHAAIFADR